VVYIYIGYSLNFIGELNGKALLNNQDVKLIRSSSLTTRELATMFNVSYYTIWDIRKNRSWLHLT